MKQTKVRWDAKRRRFGEASAGAKQPGFFSAGWVSGLVLGLLPALLGAKGCEVADVGSDVRDCGGLEGLACEDGEFCSFELGAHCGGTDATGTCQAIPEVCPEDYDPVCGCDDVTYGNECAAHAAGVSVIAAGECDSEPAGTCSGIECGEGEFCNFAPEALCGVTDARGTCEPIPEVCPTNHGPVCGCDGITYGNQCAAHAQGVSIFKQGDCEEGLETCGGLSGVACAEGEFCDYPLDSLCGAEDATGVCAVMPVSCDGVYDPVCGCDGVTYGNDCEADAAAVSVRTPGECTSE